MGAIQALQPQQIAIFPSDGAYVPSRLYAIFEDDAGNRSIWQTPIPGEEEWEQVDVPAIEGGEYP